MAPKFMSIVGPPQDQDRKTPRGSRHPLPAGKVEMAQSTSTAPCLFYREVLTSLPNGLNFSFVIQIFTIDKPIRKGRKTAGLGIIRDDRIQS